MRKLLVILMISYGLTSVSLNAANPGYTTEFSDRDGNRIMRTRAGEDQISDKVLRRKLPIRNPRILAQVAWIDRNHENAIAENVAVTPDGAGIFAGWWLNNERFSSYVSAGLDSPIWTYRDDNNWQMPVAASNANYAGTGAGMPGYLWDKDSPLFREQFELEPGFFGRGIDFSGDGTMLAMTSALGNSDALLIVYDITVDDTVFTRQFTPTTGQYGVDFSEDGSTLVVSNYSNLLVYSVPDGELLGTIGNYSQNTARISGDGSKVVIGTFNGSLFLYAWDGSQYGLSWSIYTGHDWVTAVDISTDGSTVACGTLDFQNGQIAGGKFMLLDAPSGDVLIDYDEYGDEVGGVALSGDGQYAIAGSWGQYGYTYGDVVTCFVRETDVPIFQLLDDTDEPGSIFNVAISESGGYAAAGGKAVHAREWGNGGMLYSIMIRDPLTNDVAVASIDEPGEFVNPGEDVIPTATFINVGTAEASFTAVCAITEIDSGEEIYNATFEVENLSSFGTAVVYFSPEFTMPEDGRYRMIFSALMNVDEDISNNELALVLRSWHDVKVMSIVAPFDDVTVNWPMSAAASFKNLGSYSETMDIEMNIYDSLGAPVFSTVSTIYNLAPYAEEEVVFEAWTPEMVGDYQAEFIATVEDDFFPEDNTISKIFFVVEEMIYDDGSADMSIWVNAYPYSVNRKFAQRFDPNLPSPFSITGCRVFLGPVNYNGFFDYIGVTTESGGLPDTLSFLTIIEDPPLSGPGSWSSYDLNVAVGNNEPLWLVIQWPDRDDSGPYIGGDNTGVMDQQSYWYANEAGWNQYLFSDWMIRMTLQQQTGTEFEYVSGIPDRISLNQNYPNPFNPSTRIGFALPNDSRTVIEIFNTQGRRVRVIVDDYYQAGYHSIVWDGRNESGDDVASGVYYYRLESGDYRTSRKMMLVR
ncbi:MAG: FlgD immunoglobulin-like domain containing protein [candidate division Zixibacteria bacterium]